MDILSRIDFGSILIQFGVLLFSLTIHEAAHAWTADRLGDSTARHLGRISLNPAVHIDPVGTLVFPLIQFLTNLPLIGWAKPVPVNPSRLRDPSRDQILVSLAGPLSNLLAAFGFFVLLLILKWLSAPAAEMIEWMIRTMRVPHVASSLAPLIGIAFFAMTVNLALALFNLIPVPPLDGHWMLYALLPYNAARVLERFGSYGFLLLYGLMFLGAFRIIFIPVRWALRMLLAL